MQEKLRIPSKIGEQVCKLWSEAVLQSLVCNHMVVCVSHSVVVCCSKLWLAQKNNCKGLKTETWSRRKSVCIKAS